MEIKRQLNVPQRNRLITFLKENWDDYIHDKPFHMTFLSLFVKSFLFLLFLMIRDAHATKSLNAAFNCFPSMYSISLYCFFILVFMSFAYLFRGKGHIIYLIIINLVISLFMIFDLWYYRGFASFISLHILDETANLTNLSGSIISLISPTDVLFILDVILYIVFAFRKKSFISRIKTRVFLFAFILIFSTIYVVYVPFKTDYLHKSDSRAKAFWIAWQPKVTMANLSPIGYHIYDAYEYWKDCQPVVLTSSDKKQIQQWYDEKQENLPDNQYKGLFKGKNLVLIQVESLEQFVIGQKIDGQEITPNLNKLLSHSLYFDNINEQVYNGTSSDSDLMLNASVFPVRRGSAFFRYPGNTYNSFPKLLEDMGYYTTAIHPDKGSYWNWLPALTSMGFNKCIDSTHYDIDEAIGLGISDRSYLKQIEPIVSKTKQPFYDFVVTLTSHAPYELPEKYKELKLSSSMNNSYLGKYFQIIHYTDKQLGIFIDNLKKDGLYDNTVIAVIGDHTSLHKYYQDSLSSKKPEDQWWAQPNKRIPLIVYNPSIDGKTINTIGGQIDVMPTMSYLMGIDQSKINYTAMGRNLLNTKKDFAVWADRTYIGISTSPEQKQHEIDGINLADKMISANFFKNYKNK